ncbi:DUF3150 domain-containing protein [uncultured Umboniibacter sp.]|uniref:DUF3150 domain-containing protein n=1 Tax=uncultured Umboniibacter sp. TaxID=1798917 RepID=UPI0026159F15|nr:DUF3150 domain-containing protein [uncultured Umboniibacter sp.]
MQINNLGRIAIINVDFTLWSGQSKLEESDVRLGEGGKLPSKEAAALGQKKLVDPKSLNALLKLKQRARRLADSVGFTFLNGWAIPIDRLPEIEDKLAVIRQEFEQEKLSFLNHYEASSDAWLEQHPEIKASAKAARPTLAQLERKFDLTIDSFKVDPVGEEAAKSLNDRVTQTLSHRLESQIVDIATKFYLERFCGKNSLRVTNKSLGPLTALLDKLRGLSFIAPKFAHLEDVMDDLLARLSQTFNGQEIAGREFYEAQALILILQDKKLSDQYVDAADSSADKSQATAFIQSVAGLDQNEVTDEPDLLLETPTNDSRINSDWTPMASFF